MKGFVFALGFLTRIPVPGAIFDDESARRASPWWYVAVGVAIGLALAMVSLVLGNRAPWLSAALLVGAWVVLTGALHIDGLADSADAWIGGLGDRERTLAIMKDPRCGPAGVVAIVLVLVLKVAALAGMPSHARTMAILLAPVLGRAALTVLLATTRYAREQGLASGLYEGLGARAAMTATIVSLIIGLCAAGLGNGLLAFACASVVFALWRRAGIRRLGGFTGDTAGAMVELVEVTVLIVLGLVTG